MSWPLIAVTALAVTAILSVLLLMLGLARTAAESDRIERGAVSRWVARKRHRRRAA